MEPNKILIKVSYDPSRGYTLIEKSGGPAPEVMTDNLIGNFSKAEFYRAVAKHIATRAAEGWEIEYRDTSANDGPRDPQFRIVTK